VINIERLTIAEEDLDESSVTKVTVQKIRLLHICLCCREFAKINSNDAKKNYIPYLCTWRRFRISRLCILKARKQEKQVLTSSCISNKNLTCFMKTGNMILRHST
jgi:hypothetical protein